MTTYKTFNKVQKFYEDNICPLIKEFSEKPTPELAMKTFNALQDSCVDDKVMTERTTILPDCEKECMTETIWSVSDPRSLFYKPFKTLSVALLIYYYRHLWYNDKDRDDKLQEQYAHRWSAYTQGTSLDAEVGAVLPTDEECQEVAKQFLIDVFGKDGVRDRGLELVAQDKWKL